MAKDVEIGSIDGDGNREDETVEKSPLISKNSNEATGYLTLMLSELLFNWGKRSAKLQSSDILIPNIISGLKLMRQATLLVGS